MKRPLQSPPFEGSRSGISSHERILEAAKGLFSSRGYENTSTVAIARMAGTSESQLMKHFGSKEGLLEAIFDQAWQRINWTVRRAMQGLASPAEKFHALADMTLTALARDQELKTLLLLEGRHIGKDGKMILLAQGFLEFVRMTDGVLDEMRAAGQLRSGAQVAAIRSALMGGIEGMLRDQILAQRADYPASYTAKEVREVFRMLLASFIAPASESGRRKPRS